MTFRPLRITKIQAIRDTDRFRSRTGQIARTLCDGDLGAFIRIQRGSIDRLQSTDSANALFVPFTRKTAASDPGRTMVLVRTM